MSRYDQARKDHEYLWRFGAADDMTGGYVDSEDLDKLLRNPCKAVAADCYESQISHWFSAGCDTMKHGRVDAQVYIDSDEGVREIAERRGLA